MFDPLQFKSHFPLFSQAENQSLIYLDNAATTQKPQCVLDAIVDFYLSRNGNANRASHRLARSATNVLENVRQKTADFLGAAHKDEIVFTSGATEGLNLLANGLSHLLSEGDEILLSIAEHHANLVPWQVVAKKRGAKLVFVSDDLSDVKNKITHKTKAISCTAVSNVSGQINSAATFKDIKKEYPRILLIIDASQLVGKVPVNVGDYGCDFLVCSPHKFYGPTGLGLLYGRTDCLQILDLSKFGGEMIKTVELYDSTYTQPPYSFEAGTSSLAAIAGLGACIDFINEYFKRDMLAYENRLIDYLHEKLLVLVKSFPGLELLTQPQNNIGIAAIASPKYSTADIGFWLDEHDIAVRVGDHCAQLLLDSLSVSSVLRISLSPYNTFGDIDALFQFLCDFFKEHGADIEPEKDLVIAYNENSNAYKEELSGINHHDFLNIKPWGNKYKKILMLGKQVTAKQFLHKDKNLVSGCEARLWVDVIREESNKGVIFNFVIDSDSIIVKGLAALVLCRANGKSVADIKSIDFGAYFSELGLEKYLSESRFSGIQSLLKFVFSKIS